MKAEDIRAILDEQTNESAKSDAAGKARKILVQQLELLHEASKLNNWSADDLAKLSQEVAAIGGLLLRQSQSPYEFFPYTVQLPIKDLIELYAARAEKEPRCSAIVFREGRAQYI